MGITLTDDEFEALFKKIDLSKNGAIDYTEFIAGVTDYSLIVTEKNLEMAFKFFDRDNNGSLDKAELRKILSKSYISDVEISKFMVDTDANKDNKVNSPLS